RVAVTTQEATPGEVSNSRGRSPSNGITSVCISAAEMPASTRTSTTAFGLGGRVRCRLDASDSSSTEVMNVQDTDARAPAGGSSPTGHEPADPAVRDRRPCRVHAACAVDPATGVRRRRAEVEPPHRGLRAPEPGDRAEHEFLVELGGAAVEAAADEVGVAALHLPRTQHPAG